MKSNRSRIWWIATFNCKIIVMLKIYDCFFFSTKLECYIKQYVIILQLKCIEFKKAYYNIDDRCIMYIKISFYPQFLSWNKIFGVYPQKNKKIYHVFNISRKWKKKYNWNSYYII